MTQNLIGVLWIAVATTHCPDLQLFQTAPVEAVEPLQCRQLVCNPTVWTVS